MSSNTPTTTQNLNEPDEAEESPWLKFSPEFDLAMTKGLETGTFEDSKNGKIVDMHKTRGAGIAASGTFKADPSSTANDIFREANRSRDRMTDYENNNLKRVVNNAKWHDGLHFKIHRKYKQHEHIFEIGYPGRGKWLGGTHASSNDVSLHNNRPTSVWMFEDQGRDSHGYHCYAIWAEQWGAIDYGGGFWLPDYSIARAGYDKDWEWRVYEKGERVPNGYFNLMFERVDYNE